MKKEIESFLADWKNDELGVKPVFQALFDHLCTKTHVTFELHARPGISYSMRAALAGSDKLPFFVLVDVIDDEPDERWLSICFFAASLSEEQTNEGDIVPKGLMGQDACCFDVAEPEEQQGDFSTLTRPEIEFFVKCLDSAYLFTTIK